MDFFSHGTVSAFSDESLFCIIGTVEYPLTVSRWEKRSGIFSFVAWLSVKGEHGVMAEAGTIRLVDSWRIRRQKNSTAKKEALSKNRRENKYGDTGRQI